MSAAKEPSFPVIFADDHAPTREDVRRALDGDARFEVCAGASDAAAAVQAALREQPDVCPLDLRMPGGGLATVFVNGTDTPGQARAPFYGPG